MKLLLHANVLACALTRNAFRIALALIVVVQFAFAEENEDAMLSGTRQLTFEGLRAGEGYFNADGSKMVFQSERIAENPFYQIYILDLETGDIDRVSPGHGKTTCAWIHPSGGRVLFASTHADPESLALQQAELDFRASGETRRYAWDYDEHFDIYESDLADKSYKNLTNARGYDAEGSYSPDGEWIAFASNRHAYTSPLTEEDAEFFERDKSYMMEIYIMRADGSEVTRLTHIQGYDGGPFFSPDGERIAWRRFAPNGATAEIFTMNVDGTDAQQLTDLGAMSWAPYYHPSGDYLIFTNNMQGFANFELYLVDAAGQREPVRVTYTDGFDGLPVFSPDGKRLSWTSNRTSNGKSQIFMADWNDAQARRLLGLDTAHGASARPSQVPAVPTTGPEFLALDMRAHITRLASDAMEGRRTGTRGEKRATEYVAKVFESLGLHPAGDAGTYFQEFDFTAGVSLGAGNTLTLRSGAESVDFASDADWRPLAYSKTGHIDTAEVVFAGYGIRAPKTDDFDEYDSFVHLDVEGKWVMVFRYLPENVSPEIRQHLNTHSSLRYKAMTARDLGAVGLLIVSGPNSGVHDELVSLAFDALLGGTSVGALSITDKTAERMLVATGQSLQELQDALDTGDAFMGFSLGVRLEAELDIEQVKRTGRNVLARLYAGDSEGDTAILVGAHVDHLGIGRDGSSLARDDEQDAIHYGADDNASGVAATLEIAEYLVAQKADGLALKRDVLFAAWSGEELGLLGAEHFADTYRGKDPKEPLTPEIAAVLNMDMIGRMQEKVIIQGVGSSSLWPSEIERRNIPVGLAISIQADTYLPTDATAFYLRGVPFLNAFTGAHEDYHTPRDTADKINYPDAAKIARFMGLLARSLATREAPPEYVAVEAPENLEMRANLRAYLGTIPDYTEGDIPGLQLSGVTNGGPADKAGLRSGDVIVKLAGRTIENIYDYTFAIEALKIGESVEVVVLRDGDTITMKITPGSRD